MKKLRNFQETAEAEIIEILRNLGLIHTQEQKEILKYRQWRRYHCAGAGTTDKAVLKIY